MSDNSAVHELVRDYYGRILTGSNDLKTNACCATGAPAPWLRALLGNIHNDVLDRFYGCGFPIPEALCGCTVLDLGCGSGRDVFVLSQLVGPDGVVHGVDMTDKQLEVARRTTAWHMARFDYKDPNVAFHQGFIEDLTSLDIAPGSVDVVVSNCVVNLSPRKDLVLAEIHRVLKPGGEFYFSDVFADRRLPAEVVQDPVLYAECLGGAMYDFDFTTLAKRAGFLDPRVVEAAPIELQSDDIRHKVGAARFRSATLRLFKLPKLDQRCEDYGQLATYRGTIAEAGPLFELDEHHLFEAFRPERVCSNSAMMLSDTRFGAHFEVVGDTSVHFGPFDCGATMATEQYRDQQSAGRDCC